MYDKDSKGKVHYYMSEGRKGRILYLVVPCYNEEEIISSSIAKLSEKMGRLIKAGKISPKSKIVFVNDGSKDKTLEILEDIANNDKSVKVVSFARNFGHQAAVTAGLKEVTGH